MMGLGNVGGLGRLGYAAANSVGWWLSEAQLDLDFANDRSFNRKTGYNATPNGLLTYTSPSPKMVYGTDGVLRYARHNLLTYSQEFDNAAWTKAQTSISADAVVAPDGSLTADKLVEASDVNQGHIVTRNYSVVNGLDYTISFYLKAAGRTYAFVLLSNSFTSTAISINLSTGAVADVVGTSLASTTTDEGDGWYRISLSLAASATGNGTISVYTGVGTSWSQRQYDGNGVSGIYIWGSQFCRGRSALDYLATTSAAKYDLPIDHDPLTGEALGVLIEEQRTNLLTYSEAFDNAAWTKTRSSISANSIAAPNDTMTADKLVEDTTAAASHKLEMSFASSSLTYTFSVYLKAAERTWAALQMIAVSGSPVAYFDLSNGVVGQVGSGLTATIQDAGDGWYRCIVTGVTSATTAAMTVYIAEGDGDATFTGNGTSGIYVWGAQLEAGSFATSVIQTGSAQVTRASDNITLATSAFNFSGATSTILAESDVDNLIGTHHVFSLHDGSNNERCVLRSIDAAMNYAISDGGVPQASNNVPGTVQARQMQSVAFAFAVNDIALSMDGGSITSDTSATLPTVTTLSLGASYYTGLDQLNGHIKRIVVWNTRKSNAELQALSA